MQLFYTPDITTPTYTLPEEESKHCIRVLRKSTGDTLNLTDGKGNMYTAKIIDNNVKRCVVEIIKTVENFNKLPYELTMAVAPTKNIERFEWFLEKATEIGTHMFIPIDCRHSERRVIKIDREMKVITSAVKQSLKAFHPTLSDMTTFKELLKGEFDGVKLIAHCGEAINERYNISDVVKQSDKVLILIGPEGDFSPEEVAFAVENGFKEITLGNSRLRTETAALVAVTQVAFINQITNSINVN